MNCKQAQFFMALFIAKDPDLTGQQHTDFQEHLKSCPECAREYEESKFAIELAKQYWPIGNETAAIIKKSSQNYKPKMTVEEGWKDLCRRCPDLTENTKKPESLQLFLRVGAVAACLVIGVLTWMIFSTHSTPKTTSEIASQQTVPEPKPSVKIELTSEYGSSFLAGSQQIDSGNKLQTLVINGKHRMVMNAGTSLSIEPLTVNAQLGCIVKLINGRIYTHVQHDGNPFIVDTANGQAVITGTTFDVKVTNNYTVLVVTEGTVRFKSERGLVNVGAGQLSEIVNRLAPTRPTTCDVKSLTAWVTGYKPGTALAQDKPNDIDLYLELPLRTDPIVLVKTDYDFWVNEKRIWFKTNFPWLFELKDALAKEGIEEVDYPELLIQSGNVWQFVFLQRFPGRFSVPDFESLLKTAASYDFDREWLLENVPISKLIRDKSLLSENLTGLDALNQLLKYVKGTKAMPYYLYPADAGRYLTETRSLIWFAINDGQFKLAGEQRAEVLDLLQQEVIAATSCFNDLLYLEDEKKKPLCGDVCETPGAKTIRYIEALKVIEERIAKYKFKE